MLSVQRLSPGRIEPSRSGDGLPIATNSVLVASSYAGVIHIEPPPVFQASAYLAESAFSLAVVASSATRLSSSVPRNTDPPETATPRLLGPQQAVATGSFLCVYSHNIFCVRRSNARTMLLGVAGEVMYMTPATTIGVVSKLPNVVDPWV